MNAKDLEQELLKITDEHVTYYERYGTIEMDGIFSTDQLLSIARLCMEYKKKQDEKCADQDGVK